MDERHRSDPARVLFSTTLYRDMRRVKRDLYDEGGIVKEIRELRRQQNAIFWVALGTLGTMVAGFATLMIDALRIHL